jgi:hypothetical protein
MALSCLRSLWGSNSNGTESYYEQRLGGWKGEHSMRLGELDSIKIDDVLEVFIDRVHDGRVAGSFSTSSRVTALRKNGDGHVTHISLEAGNPDKIHWSDEDKTFIAGLVFHVRNVAKLN